MQSEQSGKVSRQRQPPGVGVFAEADLGEVVEDGIDDRDGEQREQEAERLAAGDDDGDGSAGIGAEFLTFLWGSCLKSRNASFK